MTTLYWHDYETWGTNPTLDRPAQFAGVRTDLDLNIVGEPLVVFCRPAEDILPHPEACLVTGIAPQKALSDGVVEAEFIAQIHRELATPGTVGVGYNSIRFDDEVTRNCLYRNFFDPYEREWANGNGRWDIIDMTRLCYALRPEGIEWPQVDGKPSFRLELLTEANGISHSAAHDAYADVEATIAFARLVRKAQPALYDYVFKHRHKNALRQLIDWHNHKPLLHVSSKIGAERGCTTLVMPLAMHPTNKNAVIVFDLDSDPRPLLELDAQGLAERVFVTQDELDLRGEKRVPLKLIHLNRAPILATPKLLNEDSAKRLGLDLQRCWDHWQILRTAQLVEKVQQAMRGGEFDPSSDPERRLYDGFIPAADRPVMERVRAASAEELKAQSFIFEDARLTEMLWRYKARNYPASLTTSEHQQWKEFCQQRLQGAEPGILSVEQLVARIRQLDDERNLSKDQKITLQQLYRYAVDLGKRYQLGAKCGW